MPLINISRISGPIYLNNDKVMLLAVNCIFETFGNRIEHRTDTGGFSFLLTDGYVNFRIPSVVTCLNRKSMGDFGMMILIK